MTNRQFAVDYLKAIEKAHPEHFEKNKLKIMDCVTIKGTKLVRIHLVTTLPVEIKNEIETMFWVD